MTSKQCDNFWILKSYQESHTLVQSLLLGLNLEQSWSERETMTDLFVRCDIVGAG